MSDLLPHGDTDAAMAFLSHLQSNGPWCLTALDPNEKLGAITATFSADAAIDARSFITKWNGKRNIYFSVNPVRTALTKKAKKSDIEAVTYLHIDIDPRPGEDLQSEQARIRVQLTDQIPAAVPPPTVVISSGGGYQAFWKLKDPIPLDGTKESVALAESWNRQLEHVFGADSCHNVDRIMRLPGTVNLPTPKKKAKGRTPALASVVAADWARAYSLDAFLSPASSKPSADSKPRKGRLDPDLTAEPLSSVADLDRWDVPERIKIIIVTGHHPDENSKPPDDRSRWVFDVASGLIRCGVPDAVVLGILTNSEFKISAHVLEKPDARAYAIRQIEQARAAVESDGSGGKSDTPILSHSNPRRSALLFRRKRRPHLLRVGGSWLDYVDGAYAEVEEDTIKAELYAWLATAITGERSGADAGNEEQRVHQAAFKPNASKVSNVLDALKALAHRPIEASDPPVWLDSNGPPPYEIIACRNGLLHLPTLVLTPPDPRFFTRNALQFEYQPHASPPTEWLRFLAGIWGTGSETQLLQEIFGYLLVPDTSQQKIFLLVGPKRSGKGTIASVLTELIGTRNVCSPSLNSLGGDFGLQPLIGKQLAIASDMRIGYKADLAAIAENLLRISGEDGVSINRKYKDHWTGRLLVRFFIMSNEVPRLVDGSAVLATRFVPLVMERSYYGQEDLELRARLMAELPAILNWSIEGWKRLMARGRFQLPPSSQAVIEELEDMSTPISTFLREMCELSADATTPKVAIWEKWKAWCALNNESPGNARQFFKNLVAATGRAIRASKPNADGQRVPSYLGIRLREAPL